MPNQGTTSDEGMGRTTDEGARRTTGKGARRMAGEGATREEDGGARMASTSSRSFCVVRGEVRMSWAASERGVLTYWAIGL